MIIYTVENPKVTEKVISMTPDMTKVLQLFIKYDTSLLSSEMIAFKLDMPLSTVESCVTHLGRLLLIDKDWETNRYQFRPQYEPIHFRSNWR